MTRRKICCWKCNKLFDKDIPKYSLDSRYHYIRICTYCKTRNNVEDELKTKWHTDDILFGTMDEKGLI